MVNAFMAALAKARKSKADHFDYNGTRYHKKTSKTGMVLYSKKKGSHSTKKHQHGGSGPKAAPAPGPAPAAKPSGCGGGAAAPAGPVGVESPMVDTASPVGAASGPAPPVPQGGGGKKSRKHKRGKKHHKNSKKNRKNSKKHKRR